MNVRRFDVVTRVVHWTIALLTLVLLATGTILYVGQLEAAVGRRAQLATIHVWCGLLLPVPLIVGFGRAAEICQESMVEENRRIARMRDRLQDMILSSVDEAFLNGRPDRRLAGNLNISFAYVEGESVLMGLNKETALSSGSACTSSTLEPSYVISALGASAELAHSSIRFSLHRFTTEEEVEHVGARTIDVVKRLREMSPLYELAKEGVDLKSIRWKAD